MTAQAYDFDGPRALTVKGAPIQTEAPGYASPCLADLDGDGAKELLVGQFRDGKIQVFSKGEGTNYGAKSWLQAEGAVAEVPGVW